MKVAIDFDNTLTEPHIEEMVKTLMNNGVEVYIVTFRYDDASHYKYNGRYQPANNDDLWEAVERLGLSKRVYFTNCKPKSDYLNDVGDFLFLLDDDERVIKDVTENSLTKVIHVDDYKKCLEICGL